MTEASISRDCSAIVLDGLVTGSDDARMVQFILDTGASITMVPKRILQRIGSKCELLKGSVPVETAGGRINVDLYRVGSIEVLGKSVKDLDVAGYDLPVETRIEGLLGLNFLKHFKVTIDLPNGKLVLE